MIFVSIMYVDIDDNGNDDKDRNDDNDDEDIDDDVDRDNDHGILKIMNNLIFINTVMIKVVRVI
jgi:hypothetical protein